MSFWDSLHRSRLQPTFAEVGCDEVTCDDCGKTFPIETSEQRMRLKGGCPSCGEVDV